MTDAHSRPAKAIRIGRQPDNDIALTEDLQVSRHHAELRRNPDGSFEIIDLGSHGGTYVNGERITRKQLTTPTSGSTSKASPTTGTSPCSESSAKASAQPAGSSSPGQKAPSPACASSTSPTTARSP